MSSFNIQQLLMILPSALLSLLGIGVGVVFLQRYPRPALLVLVASTLRLMLAIGSTVLQISILQQSGSLSDRTQWLWIIGITSSMLHGVSYLLLLVAVFLDRGVNSVEPD